jgi:hypothetical protein
MKAYNNSFEGDLGKRNALLSPPQRKRYTRFQSQIFGSYRRPIITLCGVHNQFSESFFLKRAGLKYVPRLRY